MVLVLLGSSASSNLPGLFENGTPLKVMACSAMEPLTGPNALLTVTVDKLPAAIVAAWRRSAVGDALTSDRVASHGVNLTKEQHSANTSTDSIVGWFITRATWLALR